MREITASVTERGQVTIPAEVRRLLGLAKGDRVTFRIEDGTVVLKKPAFTWRSAYGSVPPLNPPRDWSEIKRIVAEEQADEYLKKMREGRA